MFIIYDLETTGLYPVLDKIIQIAYVIFNNEGEIINQYDIVFNDGNSDRDVYKIIPIERIRSGIHPSKTVQKIYDDFSKADNVISYNRGNFDENFMNQYFINNKLVPIVFKWINIMDIFRKYTNAIFQEKRICGMKLSELYKKNIK